MTLHTAVLFAAAVSMSTVDAAPVVAPTELVASNNETRPHRHGPRPLIESHDLATTAGGICSFPIGNWNPSTGGVATQSCTGLTATRASFQYKWQVTSRTRPLHHDESTVYGGLTPYYSGVCAQSFDNDALRFTYGECPTATACAGSYRNSNCFWKVRHLQQLCSPVSSIRLHSCIATPY